MAIPLRGDFDAAALRAAALRAAARQTKDAAQARRLLALAAVYEGATRTEAARIGGVTLQIVRDWVLRFDAEGPGGLVDRKAPGRPSRLNDVHRAALAAAIESGPAPAIHGVVRWRLVDLCQWLREEFRLTVPKQTLGRELRAMGYRKLSARPRHHAQAEGAIGLFERPSPPRWRKSRAMRASRPPRSRPGSAMRPGYCRRSQAAWARAAKRVTRVRARGCPSSQRMALRAFMPAATQASWSPVFASPMYRLRRIPKARTPCESVPSTPALTR